MRHSIVLVLIVLLISEGVPAAGQQQQAGESLRVTVVQGQQAIKQPEFGTEPIVHVQDSSGVPVAGAEVTFRLPERGPGAEFEGGGRVRTVVTDNQGLAVGNRLVPNDVAGPFRIEVIVNYRAQTTRITIEQSNETPSVPASIAQSRETPAPPVRGRGRSGKVLTILGIAAAAAIGVAFAAKGGDVSSGGSAPPLGQPPSTTIGVGTISIGRPPG
jgi:hypothetical protein